MNWKQIGIGTTVVLVVGGAIGGYSYYRHYQHRQSPEYAVNQIREALKNGNALKFERYVDVESYSSAVIDVLFATASSWEANQPYSGLDLLSLSLAETARDQIKSVAIRTIESTVRDIIESGTFSPGQSGASSSSGIKLANLLAPVGLSLSEFEGVEDIRREGNLATVGLRIRNPVLDSTFIFRVKMEQDNGDWRVTEPYNLQSLTRDIHRRQQSLIESANRVIGRRNDSIREKRRNYLERWQSRLSLSDWNVRDYVVTDSDDREEGIYFDVSLAVQNRSDNSFSSVPVTLTSIGGPNITVSNVEAHSVTEVDTTLKYERNRFWNELHSNPDPAIDWQEFSQYSMPETRPIRDRLEDWSDYLEYWRKRNGRGSESGRSRSHALDYSVPFSDTQTSQEPGRATSLQESRLAAVTST